MALENQFMRELLAWDNPYKGVINLADKNAKWVLVSALQKSIRRGESYTACRCAFALMHIDSVYLWARLVVIALEDVGVCKSTAYVLLASQGVTWRKQYSTQDLLFFLVDSLCREKGKTRALTDLMQMIEYGVHGLSQERRETLVNEEEVPMPQDSAIESAWLYALYSSARIPNLMENAPAITNTKLFESLVEQADVPEFVQWIALRSKKACRYPFYIAVLPVWWSIQKAEKTAIISEIAGTPMLKDLPYAAYDQHTVEGKRSLSYFAKACDPVREYFEKHTNLNKLAALGRVVFYLEAEKLDSHLIWEEDTQIRKITQKAYEAESGFREQQHDLLVRIVEENMDGLQRARERIVDTDWFLEDDGFTLDDVR